MDRFSLNKIIRIYNDNDGNYIEVRPNVDALPDVFDISDVCGKDIRTFSFTKKQIPLLIKALEEMKTADITVE